MAMQMVQMSPGIQMSEEGSSNSGDAKKEIRFLIQLAKDAREYIQDTRWERLMPACGEWIWGSEEIYDEFEEYWHNADGMIVELKGKLSSSEEQDAQTLRSVYMADLDQIFENVTQKADEAVPKLEKHAEQYSRVRTFVKTELPKIKQDWEERNTFIPRTVMELKEAVIDRITYKKLKLEKYEKLYTKVFENYYAETRTIRWNSPVPSAAKQIESVLKLLDAIEEGTRKQVGDSWIHRWKEFPEFDTPKIAKLYEPEKTQLLALMAIEKVDNEYNDEIKALSQAVELMEKHALSWHPAYRLATEYRQKLLAERHSKVAPYVGLIGDIETMRAQSHAAIGPLKADGMSDGRAEIATVLMFINKYKKLVETRFKQSREHELLPMPDELSKSIYGDEEINVVDAYRVIIENTDAEDLRSQVRAQEATLKELIAISKGASYAKHATKVPYGGKLAASISKIGDVAGDINEALTVLDSVKTLLTKSDDTGRRFAEPLSKIEAGITGANSVISLLSKSSMAVGRLAAKANVFGELLAAYAKALSVAGEVAEKITKERRQQIIGVIKIFADKARTPEEASRWLATLTGVLETTL